MSMLVRKFEAEDMATALKQVKETLGADALILSTRTLRKKGLGVLGKQTIEVTAAIESPAMKASSVSAARTPTPGAKPLGKVAVTKQIPQAYRGPLEVLEDEPLTVPPPVTEPRTSEVPSNPLEEEVQRLRAQLEAQDVDQLKAELDQLKGLIQQLNSAPTPASPEQAPVNPAPQVFETPAEVAPRRQAAVSTLKTQVPRHELADLIEVLEERGIDSEAAATIARFANQRMSDRQRQDLQLCKEFLTGTVADLVQASGPLWQPGQPQKKVALIGPTGVGKTTTIAKLAAAAITTGGARVALVTIDTYRIAAVEQLKVYGDIMDLPVEVVITPEQLQEAFSRHRDKDLILIDTAGRSPRDAERIAELNEFLGRDSQVENCLVLAAPTDERLLQKSVERFSALPISRLIFTKLDEADRCGVLLNIPTRANLPLAYLTNGQQVPEDLLLAEPGNVAELVMGDDTESRRIAV